MPSFSAIPSAGLRKGRACWEACGRSCGGDEWCRLPWRLPDAARVSSSMSLSRPAVQSHTHAAIEACGIVLRGSIPTACCSSVNLKTSVNFLLSFRLTPKNSGNGGGSGSHHKSGATHLIHQAVLASEQAPPIKKKATRKRT